MTRRTFVYGLAILAGCLGMSGVISLADAQQPGSPRRIGVLLVGFSPESKEAQQFRQGLLDAGYVEGRDIVIEWRSANGNFDRVTVLVADLVKRQVDVIVVESTPAAQAVKRATTTIPIVLAIVSDPINSGLVTNLAHPGGNVTGLSNMTNELGAKRLQLLKETIPRLTRVAVLWNPGTPWHANVVQDLKTVAPALSVELTVVSARTPDELSTAFTAISRADTQALYVIDSAFFATQRKRILALASNRNLPILGDRGFADAGSLMFYGTNFGDLFRQSARYVDKILKGAKPGDLPIEQPTRFELVVNLRTAKALGITFPQSILLQADEVIR